VGPEKHVKGDPGDGDISRHIGQRLRQRPLELGLTQPGLAVALNVTFQQLQRYECGTNRMSPPKVCVGAMRLVVGVA
jgi:DNA-binding transcriptional regulator YiaG